MEDLRQGARETFLERVESDYGRDVRLRCDRVLADWPAERPAPPREVLECAFKQRSIDHADTFRRFGALRYDSD